MSKRKTDGEPIPETPYTPGPWRAREYRNSEGCIWIDCDAWARKKGGALVRSTKDSARTVGGTVATAMGTGTGGSPWTVEANAALIAAAPELAEALADLIEGEPDACPYCEAYGADSAGVPHAPNCAMSRARAALRKAGVGL